MSKTQIKVQPDVLGQVLAQRQRVTERLVQIKHVIAVMSGKGGVGKSALTANLAAALAMSGRSVGVLDADIHGPSAATMLGARGQEVVMQPAGVRPAVGVAGVLVMSMDLFLNGGNSHVSWRHPGGLAADAYVWRGALEANVLSEFLADTGWGALDYLLVDMPPGADRFETLLRLVPNLTGAVVVTIPSPVAHQVVRRAIVSARLAGARLLGLVENMAGLTHDNGAGFGGPDNDGDSRALAGEMNVPYLGQVPFDSRLAHTTDAGRPLVLKSGHTPARQALFELAQKIEELI